MTAWDAWVKLLSALILSAFYSGSETGGYMVSRIHLRYRARHGVRRARWLEEVLREPQRFVFTVLLCNNVVNYLAAQTVTASFLAHGVGAGGGRVLFGLIPWNAEIAATLVLTPPMFLFAELLPKNLFRTRAEELMTRGAMVLRISLAVCRPLTTPLRLLFRALLRTSPADPHRDLLQLSPQRLRMYFSEGIRHGALTPHQNQMMENVIAMRRIPARRLMTPLDRVPAVSVESAVRDAERLLQKSGRNRCAVFRGRRNNVIGTLHLCDLMDPETGPDDPVRPLVRKAVRIRADATLQQAFSKLRKNRQPVAVLMDERDRAQGQVRIEDLARYIAGAPAAHGRGRE
ncbi:CNNM domain-containing protein [Kiritimatiella glycovorans]|uniref:Membrane CBS domain-containing protein n=1 Tax=Kiritimatiella glycovorans TaxID=1307763 RepID=A0A0G3ENH2_9BACT|nr:CNNM domain-containing protein [Kiritimatiella glycovorans]AKJ65694.1 Putative membrane CBS domain-containing protein [Kiritimatiella glycovorans]